MGGDGKTKGQVLVSWYSINANKQQFNFCQSVNHSCEKEKMLKVKLKILFSLHDHVQTR